MQRQPNWIRLVMSPFATFTIYMMRKCCDRECVKCGITTIGILFDPFDGSSVSVSLLTLNTWMRLLLTMQQCTWMVVLSSYCCCYCRYSTQIQCLFLFGQRIISILLYFSFVLRRCNTVLEAQLARASSVGCKCKVHL